MSEGTSKRSERSGVAVSEGTSKRRNRSGVGVIRVAVVQHTETEHPGHLGDWLPECGLTLEAIHPYAGQPLPAVGAFDGLVVLGGPMGALDDDVAPWLPPTRRLLAEAVLAGVPTLGVCLGGQLLAAATGGSVERGAAGPEIGVCEVALTPAAGGDPVFAGLPQRAAVGQWHYDAITALPPDAELLAASAAYPHQAFRVGVAAWGVQFHPELTGELSALWAAADAEQLRRQGRDPAALAAEVARRQPELTTTWRPLAERWAEVVTAAHRVDLDVSSR